MQTNIKAAGKIPLAVWGPRCATKESWHAADLMQEVYWERRGEGQGVSEWTYERELQTDRHRETDRLTDRHLETDQETEIMNKINRLGMTAYRTTEVCFTWHWQGGCMLTH